MRGKGGMAVATAAAVLAAAAGIWFGWGAGSGVTGRDGRDAAARVALGGDVYAANCAACHGATGAGEPAWRRRKANGKLPAPPLDGSGHTWHHPDSQLHAIITHGVEAMAPPGYASDMRGFGDHLSAAEIDAVLAYIKTWWPDELRARQAAISDRAGAQP